MYKTVHAYISQYVSIFYRQTIKSDICRNNRGIIYVHIISFVGFYTYSFVSTNIVLSSLSSCTETEYLNKYSLFDIQIQYYINKDVAFPKMHWF